MQEVFLPELIHNFYQFWTHDIFDCLLSWLIMMKVWCPCGMQSMQNKLEGMNKQNIILGGIINSQVNLIFDSHPFLQYRFNICSQTNFSSDVFEGLILFFLFVCSFV